MKDRNPRVQSKVIDVSLEEQNRDFNSFSVPGMTHFEVQAQMIYALDKQLGISVETIKESCLRINNYITALTNKNKKQPPQ